MQKLAFLFLITVFSFLNLSAQGVQGTIKNQDGEPLQYATIFVKETGSGSIANERGYYELRLAPGNYTLVFQFLGHQTHIEKVAIGELFRDLDIELNEQTLNLKTIEIYEGREDPAYTVMRKAIAKASFHRQQLDSYEAMVYIKGSGRLKKSPFFLRKRLAKEGIDSNAAFVTESVSQIKYTRPNQFEEKVISIRTVGENNSTSPNMYINGSFYEPKLADAISPLSPKAFAYYKFHLEGFFTDRGYGINKIKVTPRSRGEDVFEGYIYIVEDQWSIYRLDLLTYKFGIGFNISQVYAPIQDEVWLPVSHTFNVDDKILGFAFEFTYLATVNDYKIEINPDLNYDFEVIDEKVEKEVAAEAKAALKERQFEEIEEKLSSGKDITRKDLRKMIKEYEKEERKQQDEPEVIVSNKFEVDSSAYDRDSLYWTEIRPVPLSSFEVKGYEIQDSLAKVESMENNEQDSIINSQAKRKKGKNFGPLDLIVGYTHKLDDKHYFTHGSFLDKIQFNPVEGFNIYNKFSYVYQGDNRFSVNLFPRYAFARKKLTGKGELNFGYGPRKAKNSISLEGGRYISQYNEDNPISYLFNTILNLLGERNYIRLYEKDYAKLSLGQKLSTNTSFRASAEWAKRYTLFNSTTQTWFNRDDLLYDSNIPENNEVDLPVSDAEKAMVLSVGIHTRPWQKYRIWNDQKIPIRGSSPAFSLFYKKGIKGIANSVSNFDLIDFTYKHGFDIGVRGKVDLKVNAGIFLNKDYVGFADFKHFQGNRIALVTADPVGSFRLLDYYRYSTQDKYLSTHVHYQFRKLLFTQIPEVWLLGIKENVFVNYLATPSSQNYFELGYSLDNIFGILRLEAAFSFQDGKYQDFGVLIGVASNLGGSFTIE